MPQFRTRRAAIKKYTDAFEAQTAEFNTFNSSMRSRGVKVGDTVFTSGMRFTPYLETDSGFPDQVVDSNGDNINGPFITEYLNNDLTGSASYYDLQLKSLTQNGAFVSRFQTIKFRQFDEALHAMRDEFLPPAFSGSEEWLTVVTNTTYILENFNARLNLMNAGLQAIFQSSVFTPNPNLEFDYASRTNWPRSSWTDLPVPLTGESIQFAEQTFGDDANVIPFNPVTHARVEIILPETPYYFSFSSYAKQVIDVSVTSAATIGGIIFYDTPASSPAVLGDAIFTYYSNSQLVSNIVPATNNEASYDFSTNIQSISGDFSVVFELPTPLEQEITVFATAYSTASGGGGGGVVVFTPAFGTVSINNTDPTEFTFSTENKLDVLIVSVTNQLLAQNVNGAIFTRFTDGHQPFPLIGYSTYTVDGTATPVSSTNSSITLTIASETNFVMEMTLSEGWTAGNETIYLQLIPEASLEAPPEPMFDTVALANTIDYTAFTFETENKTAQLIVSVTNGVAESLSSVAFTRLITDVGMGTSYYEPVSLSGQTTFTIAGAEASQAITSALADFDVAIAPLTNFVFEMTLLDPVTTPNETFYIKASGISPMYATIFVNSFGLNFQFPFFQPLNNNVLILSVTSGLDGSTGTISLLQHAGSFQNFAITGSTTIKFADQTRVLEEATSLFEFPFEAGGIPPSTDFVIETTLSTVTDTLGYINLTTVM